MRKVHNADVLFIACFMLFLMHQYLQLIMGINIPFVDSYLDPFLMMPVLLHLVALERKWLLSEPAYELPSAHILGYFILVAVLSEIVFPLLSDSHTADIWDILCYALGGLLYVAIKRTPN